MRNAPFYLAAFAAACGTFADAASKSGYIIDVKCMDLCEDKAEGASCAPDGINVFYEPELHTKWCKQLRVCENSGYALLAAEPNANGTHAVELELAGDVSQANIVAFIDAGPDGPFPRVSVHYDEAQAVVQGDVLLVYNATIHDPWEDGPAYSGDDTVQILCPDSNSPDLAVNNLCFRSDVLVAETTDSYIIESNGCPDHPNMVGGSGIITDTNGCSSTTTGPSCGGTTTGACCGTTTGACCGTTTGACCGTTTGACCGTTTTAGCCSGTTTTTAGCCSGTTTTTAGCCSGTTTTTAGCCSGTTTTTAACCSGTTTVGCCSGTTTTAGCCSGNTTTTVGCCGTTTTVGCCGTTTTGGCCGTTTTGGCCGTTTTGGCCGTTTTGGCCGTTTTGACCGTTTGACCGTTTGSCCGTTTNGCSCGTTTTTTLDTFDPTFQHYTMHIPKDPSNPTSSDQADYFGDDEVVGILVNGVLLDSHAPTWSYDDCNGHSDTKHQYHYHIPPKCLLEFLSVPYPSDAQWWKDSSTGYVRDYSDMAAQFSSGGAGTPSPVLGFARDGFPIFGPYDDSGDLQQGEDYAAGLDECNGKVDDNGNYGYYLTPDPPFAPPCLRGEKGLFVYTSTEQVCPKNGINNTIIDRGDFPDCDGVAFADIADDDCLDDDDDVGGPGDISEAGNAGTLCLTAAAGALAILGIARR